jgi:hypothetical protein
MMLALTGCGGGEKNSNGGVDDNGKKGNTGIISGGTIDKPVYLKLGSRNEIKNNYFHNYFKYTAYAGEKLILHSTLDQDLNNHDWIVCRNMDDIVTSNTANVMIIYDDSLNIIKTSKRCQLDLTIEFPFSGTYILYFNYPNHNGYMEAVSVSTEWLDLLPKLNLATENEMFSNTFNNYYTYEAYGNEKFIMHTVLDQPFNNNDIIRCGSSRGGLGDIHEINFIRVYDADLNIIKTSERCGLDLVVDFPMKKKYIIHFYYQKHSGYIEARTIN